MCILGAGGCSKSLPYSSIDVHAHVEASSSAASPSELVAAMESAGFSQMIVMHTPNAFYSAKTSTDDHVTLLGSYTSQFRFLYGGNDLQPILHALGRTEPFTVESIYPNGATSQSAAEQDLTELKNIATDPSKWETEFKSRATAAADSGKYLGFGELGPHHLSRREGHPYIVYPANHSLLKWLADLAASKKLALDIHLEATDAKLSEFADLCAHNRNAKIVWDHAGWSLTGVATAEKLGAMLAANANLYLSLKLRPPEDEEMRAASPFDDSGRLRDEWMEILTTHADRIMLGSDSKFWAEGKSASSTLKPVTSLFSELLLQLPKETAEKLASGTAKAVFSL